MADAVRPTPQAVPSPVRRPWNLPRLAELPKLTALTLASAIGGGGGTGGGGSTVFGLLLALFSLALLPACFSDRSVAPSDEGMPSAVTAVTCTANVAAKVVFCGGPLNSPPPDEIIGGQGVRVVLRSRNVQYIGTAFTFDVQVQNVGAQSIGTDGVALTGVRVFFENDPVVTGGPGAVTNGADSSGTFTGSNQPYYVYTGALALGDTSAWRPWKFTVTAANTDFTFQVLVSAQVPDHGGPLRWSPISALSSYVYTDVAWSGGNDALAVGYDGHAKQWNGTTWSNVNTGTTTQLYAVAPVSQGVYLAVGDSGKIYKVSGKIWTLVYHSPGPLFPPLNNVWARDADHWFAVGEDGLIVRYNAGVWSESSVGGGVPLTMIAGTAGNATTMAATFDGLIYTSTAGGAWAPAVSPIPPGNPLTAIAFDADNNFIYAWLDFTTFTGLIVNGATVGVVPQSVVTELFPFDRDSLIASVENGVTPEVVETKFRYGAVPLTNTPMSLPNPGSPEHVTKLNDAGTAYAGICVCQNIEVTFGGAWTTVENLDAGPFVGSWGRGDTVWVAEGSGELWKIVDGAATQLNGIAGAEGIAGFSGDSLFIIADSILWVGNGVAPWAEATRLSYLFVGQEAFFNSIWGDTASHTLIVTGENGRVKQRVSGTWTELAPAMMNVSGVWGCSATQAWITSVDDQILNWSPGSLTPDLLYTAAQPLEAVTGTGCSDVWTGGENSNLYHWNGSAWAQIPVAGDSIFIRALTPRGVSAVYAGGEAGKVAAVNVAGVTSRMLVNSQSDDIRTLWRFDNGDLLAAAYYTVTLGRR